jgi:dTDP-L-rhamnose 4-epimerase
VGTGIATDVLTVAQTLCKHYGIEVPLTVSGNYRLGDIRHNYADITLAKKILKFQPKVTFDEGIRRFVDWVNHQELQTDNYEASLEEMMQKGLFK